MRLSSSAKVAALGALLLPLVSAFTDTAPLLAYSSRRSDLLDRGLAPRSAASPAVLPSEVVRTLSGKADELCGMDAVAIIEVDDLQHHAFQALPAHSLLRSRALQAPSQLAFPHVSLSHGDAARELRNAVQRTCRKAWAGKDSLQVIRLSSLDDDALTTSLTKLAEDHPNHLVVVTAASRKIKMQKRAGKDKDGDDVDSKQGLLHRYQFFSTGLLIALLVMLLLLVPAVYFATGLLSSIETPDRLGEKIRSSGDKKSQ